MQKKTRIDRAKKAEKKRKLIINSALKLFSQKGFHGTTMAEVANECGIAVGSIYHYFQGKDHLYHSVLEDKCNEILDRLKKAVNPNRSIRENFKDLVALQNRLLERNEGFFRLYLSSKNLPVLEEVRERLGTRSDIIYKRFLLFYTELMELGISRGELRDESPQRLAQAYLGLVNTFFFEWLRGNIENLAEVEEFAVSLFLDGAHREE